LYFFQRGRVGVDAVLSVLLDLLALEGVGFDQGVTLALFEALELHVEFQLLQQSVGGQAFVRDRGEVLG